MRVFDLELRTHSWPMSRSPLSGLKPGDEDSTWPSQRARTEGFIAAYAESCHELPH